MEDYQPDLGDYAVIGDCSTAALISKHGSIDWLCLPDFSSPSFFGRLVDYDNGGFFSITIDDIEYVSRHYVQNTAIIETIMHSKTGSVKLTDCMVISGDNSHYSLNPLREILRKVEIISGSPLIKVKMIVKPGYAKSRGKFSQRGALGWAFNSDNSILNLVSNFPLVQNDSTLYGEIKSKTNAEFWFSLTYENTNPAIFLPIDSDAETRMGKTAIWWRKWVADCNYQGDWQDNVIRSLIILRMLTFATSGALIAAPTTSLPERAGGSMNWDYRYCWPRDAALALSAFMKVGFDGETNVFFGWLLMAINSTRPYINVIYDVYGRNNLKEQVLDFKGYKNAKPVRIGNAAAKQIQHDVYGEVMQAVEYWINYHGKPSGYGRRLIKGIGKVIKRNWRKPDNGIWEIRDELRHYTHSKAMAWYVFDSLIRLHEKKCIKIPLQKYMLERDELRKIIEERGFNAKRNCFVAILDGDTVDASLLLLPEIGFVKYDDPRMVGTWEAISADLKQNELILRYPPGFGHSEPGEGALMICNFWAVDYLTGLGRRDEAEKYLARLVSLSNDVGLFNEAINTKTLQPLGNMPQSYSHAGLINSVVKLYGSKNKNQRRQHDYL